ncbi:MAG: septum formation family protein [Beutenbergiaceae bacterium]
MTTPWDPNQQQPQQQPSQFGQPQPGQPVPQQPGQFGQPQPGQFGQQMPGQPGMGGYGGPPPRKSNAPVLIVGIVVAALVLVGGFFLIRGLLSGDDSSASGDSSGSGDVDSPQDVRDIDLSVGNCLATLDYNERRTLDQVPCADPHTAEVIVELTMDDGDFPGDDVVADEVDAFCSPAVEEALPADLDTSDLGLYTFFPVEATWEVGDRDITCLLIANNDAVMTGSITQQDFELS